MSERNGSSNNKRGGSKQQAKKRKSRGRGRSKRVDPLKYWGDRDQLVIPESFDLDTPDTAAVATSLGRAPIPGQENASRHYFSLVYDRAALLAGALAAAGDLDNMAANAERIREELEAEAEEAAEDEADDDLDVDEDEREVDGEADDLDADDVEPGPEADDADADD
ncbi:MAG: hypothetical protein AAF480_18780 [Actinomycetota bacterium]